MNAIRKVGESELSKSANRDISGAEIISTVMMVKLVVQQQWNEIQRPGKCVAGKMRFRGKTASAIRCDAINRKLNSIA